MPIKSKELIYYVYGLYRPNGRIFYVGYGKNGRMYDHRREAVNLLADSNGINSNDIRNKIIHKIWRGHEDFEERIIASGLSRKLARRYERKLIQDYGRINLGTGILANMTDGGDGPGNYSTEARKRMGDANTRTKTGVPRSKESIEKQREYMLNLPEEIHKERAEKAAVTILLKKILKRCEERLILVPKKPHKFCSQSCPIHMKVKKRRLSREEVLDILHNAKGVLEWGSLSETSLRRWIGVYSIDLESIRSCYAKEVKEKIRRMNSESNTGRKSSIISIYRRKQTKIAHGTEVYLSKEETINVLREAKGRITIASVPYAGLSRMVKLYDIDIEEIKTHYIQETPS